MTSPPTGITVTPVRTWADRRAFRLLPFRLYAGDAHWVAPLNRDIKGFLAAERHPFSQSGTMEFFLARRGKRVVGRIAAIENRAHNAVHHQRIAFFGFFETEDDPAIAAALLATVESWAVARGLTAVRGPCSPSTNYECGLLVEDSRPGPPVIMMAYNPLWYAGHIEARGFRKVMDLFAFYQAAASSDIERWARLAERVRTRAGVSVRQLDLAHFERDTRLIVELYHDAWSENWGFVPINEAEVRNLAKELRPVMVPWLGSFVVKEGREIGFSLGLPDYNRVQIGLRGRLLPFGIIKLLRAKNRIPFMRILLMGVRKEFQSLGLDALLYDNIVRNCLPRGISENESSWILETNLPMINTLERIGAKRYRTYRIYEKSLA